VYQTREDCCARHDACPEPTAAGPERWWPAEANGVRDCVHGADYPEGYGSALLFQSWEDCCAIHDCPELAATKAESWWPTTVNGVRDCVYGADYPTDYVGSIFLYQTREDCCALHDVCPEPIPPREEFWYPHLADGAVTSCIKDANYIEDYLDEKVRELFLFETRAGCCKAFGCVECPEGQCYDPDGVCGAVADHCQVDPCYMTRCGDGTVCKANYCGGCHAVCTPVASDDSAVVATPAPHSDPSGTTLPAKTMEAPGVSDPHTDPIDQFVVDDEDNSTKSPAESPTENLMPWTR
jgi:hypothetical protein